MPRIIGDLGHGGIDSGATGNNLTEKILTLEIGLKVQKKLAGSPIEFVLDRSDDRTINPAERTALCNKIGGDMCISIHINSSMNTGANGIEAIYSIHDNGNMKRLSDLLIDCVSKETGMNKRSSYTRQYPGIPNKDYYFMIRETNMDALIIENGFISNVEDAQKLNTEKIANGIVKALKTYYNVKESDDTVEEAILCYSMYDLFNGAVTLSRKLGNCAIYVRDDNHSFNQDVMKVKHLNIIGGSSVNHPNETIMSGVDSKGTLIAVSAKL